MTQKNRFIDFLIANSSYNDFVRNLRHFRVKRYGFGVSDKTLDNLLDACLRLATITGAFPLRHSEEGEEFWRWLKEEWELVKTQEQE